MSGINLYLNGSRYQLNGKSVNKRKTFLPSCARLYGIIFSFSEFSSC